MYHWLALNWLCSCRWPWTLDPLHFLDAGITGLDPHFQLYYTFCVIVLRMKPRLPSMIGIQLYHWPNPQCFLSLNMNYSLWQLHGMVVKITHDNTYKMFWENTKCFGDWEKSNTSCLQNPVFLLHGLCPLHAICVTIYLFIVIQITFWEFVSWKIILPLKCF